MVDTRQFKQDHSLVAGFLLACGRCGLKEAQIREKIAAARRVDPVIDEAFEKAALPLRGYWDDVATTGENFFVGGGNALMGGLGTAVSGVGHIGAKARDSAHDALGSVSRSVDKWRGVPESQRSKPLTNEQKWSTYTGGALDASQERARAGMADFTKAFGIAGDYSPETGKIHRSNQTHAQILADKRPMAVSQLNAKQQQAARELPNTPENQLMGMSARTLANAQRNAQTATNIGSVALPGTALAVAGAPTVAPVIAAHPWLSASVAAAAPYARKAYATATSMPAYMGFNIASDKYRRGQDEAAYAKQQEEAAAAEARTAAADEMAYKAKVDRATSRLNAVRTASPDDAAKLDYDTRVLKDQYEGITDAEIAIALDLKYSEALSQYNVDQQMAAEGAQPAGAPGAPGAPGGVPEQPPENQLANTDAVDATGETSIDTTNQQGQREIAGTEGGAGDIQASITDVETNGADGETGQRTAERIADETGMSFAQAWEKFRGMEKGYQIAAAIGVSLATITAAQAMTNDEEDPDGMLWLSSLLGLGGAAGAAYAGGVMDKVPTKSDAAAASG